MAWVRRRPLDSNDGSDCAQSITKSRPAAHPPPAKEVSSLPGSEIVLRIRCAVTSLRIELDGKWDTAPDGGFG